MPDLQSIMYVEDDPDIQVVARMALEALGGFAVTVCSSGEEALTAAVAEAPDLFLLDVMMPGMDGPATLAALRREPSLADVPVIFITAKVQTSEVEYYTSLGAVAVISKPFDPMTLAADVRAIWERRPAP